MSILIFAQGRTGSSLLESLLGSTGYTTHGELCKNGKYCLVPDKLNCTAHLKVWHVEDPLTYIRDAMQKGWDIVYLQRINLIRHVLSNIVALDRESYKLTKQVLGKRVQPILVDPVDFRRRLDTRLQYLRKESEIVSELDRSRVFNVAYETDLISSTNHQQTIDSIRRWQGKTPQPVSTDLVRIVDCSLRKLVVNYSELERTLQDIGFDVLTP